MSRAAQSDGPLDPNNVVAQTSSFSASSGSTVRGDGNGGSSDATAGVTVTAGSEISTAETVGNVAGWIGLGAATADCRAYVWRAITRQQLPFLQRATREPVLPYPLQTTPRSGNRQGLREATGARGDRLRLRLGPRFGSHLQCRYVVAVT
jgi:hypothetical protein